MCIFNSEFIVKRPDRQPYIVTSVYLSCCIVLLILNVSELKARRSGNFYNLSVIRQKCESQNGFFKSVSGGKKCSFFGKFDVLCFLEKPVLRFVLLPYCRPILNQFVRQWTLNFFAKLAKIGKWLCSLKD